jgi:hypothetical protein
MLIPLPELDERLELPHINLKVGTFCIAYYNAIAVYVSHEGAIEHQWQYRCLSWASGWSCCRSTSR